MAPRRKRIVQTGQLCRPQDTPELFSCESPIFCRCLHNGGDSEFFSLSRLFFAKYSWEAIKFCKILGGQLNDLAELVLISVVPSPLAQIRADARGGLGAQLTNAGFGDLHNGADFFEIQPMFVTE